MWADAQRDVHLAEYKWCPLLNATNLADANYSRALHIGVN